MRILSRRTPAKVRSNPKIKDGGHNFRFENTEHSLAKITAAMQATKQLVIEGMSRIVILIFLELGSLTFST